MAGPSFALRVRRWQRAHGRHGLPWQGTRDAYRIWLSEVMLQQTQVATVLPYYERFLARFPSAAALADADEEEVLRLWSGLGYYARARNLLRAARVVVGRHGGVFPTRFEELAQLPGVGRSTAAAIAAFASGERCAILDGNVRRVLARHAGIPGDPASSTTLQALWSEAEARLPRAGIEEYTQGMMDLGAQLCTTRKPACLLCPVARDCVARLEDRVAELPSPRARKRGVRRSVGMLVVVRAGEVLLQKRPATGIWGGLWSLPEMPDGADARAVARERWALDGETVALPAFEHAFTHFTLEVRPYRLRVPRGAAHALAREDGALWMPLQDIAGAALPAPIKKLLLALE
jgi:A/G-specific adenine glycosylase